MFTIIISCFSQYLHSVYYFSMTLFLEYIFISVNVPKLNTDSNVFPNHLLLPRSLFSQPTTYVFDITANSN